MRTWGGSEDDSPHAMLKDNADAIYLAQAVDSITIDGTDTIKTNSPDMVIRKFDTNGNRLWTKQFGDVKVDFFSLLKIVHNRILITGEIDSITTIDGTSIISLGTHDLLIASLDTSGNLLSHKNFGGPGAFTQTYYQGDVDENGNIYLPVTVFSDSVMFDTIPGAPGILGANLLCIFDSSFNTRKIFNSTSMGDTMSFGNIYSVSDGAIVTGRFSDTVSFSATTLNAGNCASTYLAQLNFTTSIYEIENQNTFSIYPNPVDQDMHIKLNANSMENITLNIYSILGNTILEVQLPTGKTEYAIKINQQFTSGIYLATIRFGDKILTQRIVVR